MKTKLMTLQDATGFFRDGMTIMVGGFMGIGTPSRLTGIWCSRPDIDSQ